MKTEAKRATGLRTLRKSNHKLIDPKMYTKPPSPIGGRRMEEGLGERNERKALMINTRGAGPRGPENKQRTTKRPKLFGSSDANGQIWVEGAPLRVKGSVVEDKGCDLCGRGA